MSKHKGEAMPTPSKRCNCYTYEERKLCGESCLDPLEVQAKEFRSRAAAAHECLCYRLDDMRRASYEAEQWTWSRAAQMLEECVKHSPLSPVSTTGNSFPGNFKAGDIVSNRKDIGTPTRHGSVIRTAYGTDGDPLVIVHWPHAGMCIEAPEDLRIS